MSGSFIGAEDNLDHTATALVDLAEHPIHRAVLLELGAVENVGDVGALDVASKPLDQLEVRVLRWQPEDLKVAGDAVHIGQHKLCPLEARPITHEDDFAPRARGAVGETALV